MGIFFTRTLSQKGEALLRYRECWKKHFYKPKYQALANRIANGSVQAMTVSEHSRASIRAFFPQLMNVHIPVFYSPMREIAPKGLLPSGIFPKNYFLLTSGARWEKNNLRAVRTFDNLMDLERARFPHQVIVTGVTNPQVYRRHHSHEQLQFIQCQENFIARL